MVFVNLALLFQVGEGHGGASQGLCGLASDFALLGGLASV